MAAVARPNPSRGREGLDRPSGPDVGSALGIAATRSSSRSGAGRSAIPSSVARVSAARSRSSAIALLLLRVLVEGPAQLAQGVMGTRLDGAGPGAGTFRDLVDSQVEVEAQDDHLEVFGAERAQRTGHRVSSAHPLGRIGGGTQPRPVGREGGGVQTQRFVPASALSIATGGDEGPAEPGVEAGRGAQFAEPMPGT